MYTFRRKADIVGPFLNVSFSFSGFRISQVFSLSLDHFSHRSYAPNSALLLSDRNIGFSTLEIRIAHSPGLIFQRLSFAQRTQGGQCGVLRRAKRFFSLMM